MKLQFVKNYTEVIEEFEVDDKDGAFEKINEYLTITNTEVYYMRIWYDGEGWTYIDYGSHTHFFRYEGRDEDLFPKEGE